MHSPPIPAAASRCSTWQAGATTPSCAIASSGSTRAATCCFPTSRTWASPWRPATSSSGRSGGSLFEFAAAGRPALLVPYPYATADHQTSNARWMEVAGAAVVLADEELSPQRLRREVVAILDDSERLRADVGGGTRPGQAGRRRPDRRRGPGRRGPMKGRTLHFIGIGGAGMSGLALVCDRLGARVSGSDRAESSYTRRLREAGDRGRRSATTRQTCRPRPRWSSPRRSARTTRSWPRPGREAR